MSGLLGSGFLNGLLGVAPQAQTSNTSLLAQALKAREGQFQRGIQATPWYSEFQQKYGEKPNLNDPEYNYRAAWSAGLRPERYAPDGGAYHWPSSLPNGQMLKSENHPTAWMEHFMRATGKDPNALGIDQATAMKYLQSIGNK